MRLLTRIEIDEPASTPRDADRELSVTALLELELTSGRRVTLLDGRGWSCSGPSDIWAHTSLRTWPTPPARSSDPTSLTTASPRGR
jgi:hypothetical protein